ncbi:MAG: type 2 isopentenyl-diphosphate Delta-isomerase [Desulfurococcales archaeon]|nr:type 2 isopentenyl-diphosphate Delta-isomerase [Desulfurococcales archaeon]
MVDDILKDRKLDHINVVLERNPESIHPTLLDDVRIVHNPLPEVDLDDVSLKTNFCGREIPTPLMITGMTGGHPEVEPINEKLARVAQEYGLAMGVGSQRPALKYPELARTYRVARKVAPDIFLVANIGAPQLAREYGIEDVKRAVEMIDADAIAIHLNPGQEAFQKEGDPFYAGVTDKIVEILDHVNVPLIIKETGTGISYEVARELYNIGVKCFDTAGLGGTNWIKVEVLRSLRRGEAPLPAGPLADYWGNPTALAVIETRTAAPGAYIVGSGGIRDGLDAAKVIALGADIAGLALPALRVLIRSGVEGLRKYINSILYQIKSIIFLTGGKRPVDLWRTPITITGRLYEEAKGRGINLTNYINITRINTVGARR